MPSTPEQTLLHLYLKQEGGPLGLKDVAIPDALLAAEAEHVDAQNPGDVRAFLRGKVTTKAHWFQAADPLPVYGPRQAMSASERAAAISTLGYDAYLNLPWDEHEATQRTHARDAQGRFRSGLRRSLMTAADKAAYITSYGQAQYLALPE